MWLSAQNIKRNDNGISCPTASVHLQAMGELADSQAWCGIFWLHWGHSSANTWSREIIHASKSIGWRLNSSILHHLLMQKKRYLCTEQVTSNKSRHGRLTSNPHWPCECICYEADSSVKMKNSRTRHLPKSSDESVYYSACYVRHICPLLYVQGSGKVQNLPQILPHMHKMLSYAYTDWG